MSAEVVVSEPRECDIHRYVDSIPGVPAEYDGKTKDGPWAHMCAAHFETHGVGLGTGRGQRLLVLQQ